MARQQTWQARRFKIFESACHFRIESGRPIRIRIESRSFAGPYSEMVSGLVLGMQRNVNRPQLCHLQGTPLSAYIWKQLMESFQLFAN